MIKKGVSIGLMAILMIIVAVSGCTDPNSQTKHFDNGKLSFNHSSDIIIIDNSNNNSPRWPTYLRLSMPYGNSSEDIIIHSEKLTSSFTIKNVMEENYLKAKKGTLNGKYEIYTVNDTATGWSGYWVISNNTVYVIEVPITTPEVTHKIEQILNSLEIK